MCPISYSDWNFDFSQEWNLLMSKKTHESEREKKLASRSKCIYLLAK